MGFVPEPTSKMVQDTNQAYQTFLKKKNNLLNHIHERALRVIDQYYNSYFIELLRKDSSLKTYQGKLNVLVTEMLKVKVAPDIMKEIFEI